MSEQPKPEDQLKDIRIILAGTDIKSLPEDYETTRMAEDRMDELIKAKQEIKTLKHKLDILAQAKQIVSEYEPDRNAQGSQNHYRGSVGYK